MRPDSDLACEVVESQLESLTCRVVTPIADLDLPLQEKPVEGVGEKLSCACASSITCRSALGALENETTRLFPIDPPVELAHGDV